MANAGTEGTEVLGVFRALAGFIEDGVPCALCTVEETSGSTPREPGARMAVPASGAPAGTVGGGVLESTVIDRAREAIAAASGLTLDLALDERKEGGIPSHCGGRVRVRIEVIAPPRRVVIFGAGHVGAATARVARAAGFAVVVVDDREDALGPLRRDGIPVVSAAPDAAVSAAGVRATDALVIVTRGHALDLEVARRALVVPASYVGMIGSRRKVAVAREALGASGVPAVDIARLRAPIGLDIGAETPGELALAIVAEIVSVLHGSAAGTEDARGPRPRP